MAIKWWATAKLAKHAAQPPVVWLVDSQADAEIHGFSGGDAPHGRLFGLQPGGAITDAEIVEQRKQRLGLPF